MKIKEGLLLYGILLRFLVVILIMPKMGQYWFHVWICVLVDFIVGWHLCQLEVLECKEIPWPNADVAKSYNIDDCGWPSKNSAYECKINLLTGKTHQVRAQLAFIGAPIVGDSMYMPSVLAEMDDPYINPFSAKQKEYACEDDRMAAVEEWIARYGKEPSAAIGLQACQISWDDDKCFYKAGTPWWRQETA